MTIRTALIGFGKIARDEHVPAINQNPDFELVAIVTPNLTSAISCPHFNNVGDMFAAMPGGIDAAVICTPPAPRFEIACACAAQGIALMLEKPPTATLGELDSLAQIAETHKAPIFTAWHSQYAAAVNAAQHALADEDVTSISLLWQENVRKFHAGQEWIWEAGGFGVFDPGINGISILTRILPGPLLVHEAILCFPGNKQSPISAEVRFHGNARTAILDWGGSSEERWSIDIKTKTGKSIEISHGGAALAIDGMDADLPHHDEYLGVYKDFGAIVKSRRSRIDREPMRIVADCFLIGTRKMVEDFV